MGHSYQVRAGRDGWVPVLDSYARLSRNPSGRLEKVETQHGDNRRVIERLGGVLGEELTDDDLSAWKPSVRRPDWERLLERLASGESDGAVVWHVDRLMRLPRDLERLLELAGRGVTLGSAHGEWDLSDPNDRFILRVEVAHACRSSDDTSRRLRDALEDRAWEGRPHSSGQCPYGYAGDAVTIIEGEAVIIRDIYARHLEGASPGLIARELTERGEVTVSGKPWQPMRCARCCPRGM